jgi:hypothetical protein
MDTPNSATTRFDRLIRASVNARMASKAAVPLAKWYVHKAVSRRDGTRTGRFLRSFGL